MTSGVGPGVRQDSRSRPPGVGAPPRSSDAQDEEAQGGPRGRARPPAGRGGTARDDCARNGRERFTVRKGGLEPPRPLGHTLLRRARLPFRHFRAGLQLSLAHAPRPARRPRACYLYCFGAVRTGSDGRRPPAERGIPLKVEYVEETSVRKALTFEIEAEVVEQEIEARAQELRPQGEAARLPARQDPARRRQEALPGRRSWATWPRPSSTRSSSRSSRAGACKPLAQPEGRPTSRSTRTSR